MRSIERKWMINKALLFLLIILNFSFSQSQIEKDSEYLSQYIGYWPPSIAQSEDSLKLFTDKLKDYIKKIRRNEYQISDSSQYYYRLGQAYSYGHNIDMEGAWDSSEICLKKSLKFDPYSIESKIELGKLYTFSNPDKLGEAYRLLSTAIEQDTEKRFPEARYTFAMCALMVGAENAARKAALEYRTLMGPDTTGIGVWMNMIFYKYNTYISKDTVNDFVEYENSYAGFKVVYPASFGVYYDDVYNSMTSSSMLSLITPLAYSVYTDSITNAIAVVTREADFIDIDEIMDNFLKRMMVDNSKKRASFVRYKQNKSIYFISTDRPKENYKGVITAIKSSPYNYVLIYNATEHTFDQNYKYFIDFEKRFEIIERKNEE